jgi:cytochrome c peroxidase
MSVIIIFMPLSFYVPGSHADAPQKKPPPLKIVNACSPIVNTYSMDNGGGSLTYIQKNKMLGKNKLRERACRKNKHYLAGKLVSLIKAKGLTGDPTKDRTLPSIEDPKAQLGKRLFFTKGLGGDNDSACVTCHHPMLGGGDNLSLSVGTGAESPDLLGFGRHHSIDAVGGIYDGGPPVPRNAPTTFNIGMWDQVLFHDGRVESLGKSVGANGDDGFGIRTPDSAFNVADPNSGSNLVAAQSRFPPTSPEEMRGFSALGDSNEIVRNKLAEKLSKDWGNEFAAIFGDGQVNYSRIAEAIGEYERSMVFVDSPWKAFVEGDYEAMSEPALRGGVLFFSTIEKGGANCASCHSGDFFTDEKFHVLATPQIGRGKGDNNGTLSSDDFGRYRESGDVADMYKFRTPTLLNVEVTGPWGHAGGYTSLEGIVRHMAHPAKAIVNYNFSQLDPTVQTADMLTNTQFALKQLELNRANNVDDVHQVVELTDQEVTDIVEFLHALTDPCVKDRACLAPWIPDETDNDPDGLRLNAVDSNGVSL